MRLFIANVVFACFPCLVMGQDLGGAVQNNLEVGQEAQFRLGGAAIRSAMFPTAPIVVPETQRPSRLSFPIRKQREEAARKESSLGAATIFVAEGLDAGRDALELGTFLSSGQARAGLSVTYLEIESEVARSEVFVDYALTERFSVGLSGILDSELGSETDPVRQLGLNAEFSSDNGTFVQGGVAGAADYDPVIGLSVGLRF